MNTKYKTQILVIEDNSGDFELLKIFMEESGAKGELYRAESLYEGLELLQNKKIDLVLLDLNLPDSTGFKTISSFLERAPNIPVIVLTGTNNEIIGNQAVKAGAQDFLVKGQFDNKMLGRVIRYSLERSGQQYKLEETAKELELHRRRFLEAQEMAHFGSWEMDMVTNEMKWTDVIYRIFGFLPGVLQPSLSTYMDFVHPDDMHSVEAFFNEAARDSKLHKLEHRIINDGKNIKYVILHAKIQVDETISKILLVGGLQDITERKLSEKLILEKHMSSKTARIQEDALSELSFQIRTPLTSVVSLLYLLENNRPGTHQTAFIDDLKLSVDDLSIAVGNLLNFTVMFSDEVKMEEEEFNIRDVIQGTVNVLKLKADAGKLGLELRIDDKIPEKVISDPKKLTQVLYNLLDNAIRYSSEGGKILVMANAGETKGATINLLLSVKDMGKGISKARMQELESMNKELNGKEPGKDTKMPMGLAIVDKLLTVLGGNHQIQSKEGIGTTVTCNIPVKSSRPVRFVEGEAPDAPMKILLVEDHFLNQIATKKVLNTWSDFVEVDIAENGAIALEIFKSTSYDLILMDIQMPVMNGIDCTRKIREISDVPIIALTANASKLEQDKCFEIGMNDYLSKPFKPQELYSRIIKILSFVLN